MQLVALLSIAHALARGMSPQSISNGSYFCSSYLSTDGASSSLRFGFDLIANSFQQLGTKL